MTHLWFPNSKENTLSKGALGGQWTPQSARSLGDQASNLSYDGITSRINSLPTPWSRAIQFENAITDPSYPTRDQLLDELFGGLAVLALWSLYNLEVQAETVRLKELKKDRDPAVRLFASSLKVNQPAPEHSILAAGRSPSSSPWDVLDVFMVQGQPIGFSSPSTLFCPAVQLRQPIDGVDWSQEGRFSNPTPHLTLKEHSQPLANWLEKLAKEILSLESDNRNLVEDLAKELRGFGGQLDEEPSSGTPGKGGEIKGSSKGPLFEMLSWSAAAVEPGDSSCRLVLGDKQEKNKKPVILVDPDMPKQLQKEASAIHLYGAQTLATISKDAEQLRERHKNEIDVVTPDELFLPNLTLLPGGKALVKSWLPH